MTDTKDIKIDPVLHPELAENLATIIKVTEREISYLQACIVVILNDPNLPLGANLVGFTALNNQKQKYEDYLKGLKEL